MEISPVRLVGLSEGRRSKVVVEGEGTSVGLLILHPSDFALRPLCHLLCPTTSALSSVVLSL